MITWDEDLRCTEGLEGKIGSIRRKLRRRKLSSVFTYCIALPTNPNNLLDIYNCGELLFRHYQNSPTNIHIIGIAEDKESAQELTVKLVEEVYNSTGGFDFASKFNKDMI